MIKFGTSGWRAIISDEFTFANVRLVTQAIANVVKKSQSHQVTGHKSGIVVGYDTRFLSKEFADACAKVLAANDIEVLLCDRDTPTPVIAYQILQKKASGGINFTASHNPPEYNGIKFSPETAAPAPPEATKQIEEEIRKLQDAGTQYSILNTQYKSRERINLFDPKPEYFKQIKKLINFTAIKKAKMKIAIDCLYGTSRGYLDTLLKGAGCKIEVLHDWLNPSFDGKRPEPAEENIQALIELVKKKKMHIGLSCDGDADRFGIVDSDGAVISANQVISLLLYYLIKTRPQKKYPKAMRTVATTHMMDKICAKFGVEIHETPVGFKYFSEYLAKDNCIIAGEESGGLSVSGHVPEKDGILACLLMAEMIAVNKKSAGKLLKSLYKEFGYFYFERLDLTISEDKKKKLMDNLINNTPEVFANQPVISVNKKDGCKLLFKDESWILFRASGTEPIVRCYFEARTSKRLKELMSAGKELT